MYSLEIEEPDDVISVFFQYHLEVNANDYFFKTFCLRSYNQEHTFFSIVSQEYLDDIFSLENNFCIFAHRIPGLNYFLAIKFKNISTSLKEVSSNDYYISGCPSFRFFCKENIDNLYKDDEKLTIYNTDIVVRGGSYQVFKNLDPFSQLDRKIIYECKKILAREYVPGKKSLVFLEDKNSYGLF